MDDERLREEEELEEEEEEIEEEDEDDDDEEEDMDAGEVYLPGKPIAEGEELVYDSTAYHLYHAAQTDAPCLSFDIISDALGDNRSDYPATAYIVSATQAEASKPNHLMLMKLSGMERTKQPSEDDEESDSDSDDESTAEMSMARVKHTGAANRVRSACIGNRQVVATFAETGYVHLWDATSMLQRVDNPVAAGGSKKKKANVHDLPGKPLFSFHHQREGFALDWSTLNSGRLASGDCLHHIHVWDPQEGGRWNVNQQSLSKHTSSVEDLQWSPQEANVLASCSADRSIRIWDVACKPSKACKITVDNAHAADVNVLSWNKRGDLFVSGGDDGVLKTWDLRHIREPVAEIKHHTGAVTSVEWLPTDSGNSVFASSGADDQIVQWDLSVEADAESGAAGSADGVPPALLFIHQGQKDIKEIHWHPQIPGLMISTAQSGFNVFRTISV